MLSCNIISCNPCIDVYVLFGVIPSGIGHLSTPRLFNNAMLVAGSTESTDPLFLVSGLCSLVLLILLSQLGVHYAWVIVLYTGIVEKHNDTRHGLESGMTRASELHARISILRLDIPGSRIGLYT